MIAVLDRAAGEDGQEEEESVLHGTPADGPRSAGLEWRDESPILYHGRSDPPLPTMPIASIPEILDELRQGKMIILVDDPARVNEGDLAMLAEHVTPQAINFMMREDAG